MKKLLKQIFVFFALLASLSIDSFADRIETERVIYTNDLGTIAINDTNNASYLRLKNNDGDESVFNIYTNGLSLNSGYQIYFTGTNELGSNVVLGALSVGTNGILTYNNEINTNVNGDVVSVDQLLSLSNSIVFLNGSKIMLAPLNMGSNSVDAVSEILLSRKEIANSTNEGALYYDYNSHTLVYKTDIADASMNIGDEMWVRVTNNTGHLISNGVVVCWADSDISLPGITEAIADDQAKSRVMGLATHDIPSNSVGWVTAIGNVHDVDTSMFADGAELYLSKTPGVLITNYYVENQINPIFVGRVNVSDVSTGVIRVYPENDTADPVVPTDFGIRTMPTYYFDGTNKFFFNGDGIGWFCGASNYLSKIYQRTIPATNFTIQSNTYYYMAAMWNGGDVKYTNDTAGIIFGSSENYQVLQVYWNGEGRCWVFEAGKDRARSLAVKLSGRMVETEKFARARGVSITANSGTNQISLTSGTIWYDGYGITIPSFNMEAKPILWYYNSNDTWIVESSNNLVSSFYDNGTNLVALVGNAYAVGWVYQGMDTNKSVYYVLANQSYAKAIDAENSQPRSDLPTVIQNQGLLAGRFAIQNGYTTIYSVDSAFALTFTGEPVLDHNALNNLQGGQVDEYYHLKASEHSNAIASNPTLDSINFNLRTTSPRTNEGTLYYDQPSRSLVYKPGYDATMNIGQEIWIRITNGTPNVISNGWVVSSTNSGSDNPIFDGTLAQAGNPERDNILGVATHDIQPGEEGIITTLGEIHDLNTSTYLSQQDLYCSTNPGHFTTNYIAENQTDPRYIGRVQHVGTTDGIIYVRPGAVPFDSRVAPLAITVYNISNNVDNASNRINIATTQIYVVSNYVQGIITTNGSLLTGLTNQFNYVSNNAAYIDRANNFTLRPQYNGSDLGITGEQPLYDGVFIRPVITNTATNGLIYISGIGVFNIYGDSSGTGQLHQVSIPETNIYLSVSNNYNYIRVNYNNGSSYYSCSSIPPSTSQDRSTRDIATIYWISTNSIDEYNIQRYGPDAVASIEKETDRLIALRKYERYLGLTLDKTYASGLEFKMGAGALYYGLQIYSLSTIYSTNSSAAFLWYLTNSSWTLINTNIAVNNYYNDGTNLVSADADQYIPNWVYLFRNCNGNHLYFVLGNQYSSLIDAQNSDIPTTPTYFDYSGLLLGQIVTKQGNTNIQSVSSAFTESYSPTVVTSHNNLSGLQGGTAGEYYHITATEYDNVINITGNLTSETNRAYQTELAISNYFQISKTNLQDQINIETNRAKNVEAGITNWINVFTNEGVKIYGTNKFVQFIGKTDTDPNDFTAGHYVVLDGPKKSTRGYAWADAGDIKWDAEIWNNEDGEFWYLWNWISQLNVLTISEGGRVGINKAPNTPDYHSLFVGIGLDDAVWGGLYSGRSIKYVKVIITGNGPPDTFQYAISQDNTAYVTNGNTFNCSLTETELTNGITILFESATGHSIGDYWIKNVFPQLPQGTLTVTSPKFEEVLYQPQLGTETYYDRSFAASYSYAYQFLAVTNGTTNSALYLGNYFPWGCAVFFQDSIIKTNGVVLISEFWDGTNWTDFANLNTSEYFDYTYNLTRNGKIEWNKKNINWVATNIAGYEDVMYWARFRSTNPPSTPIYLTKIGQHSGVLQSWYRAFNDDVPIAQIDGDGNFISKKVVSSPANIQYTNNENRTTVNAGTTFTRTNIFTVNGYISTNYMITWYSGIYFAPVSSGDSMNMTKWVTVEPYDQTNRMGTFSMRSANNGWDGFMTNTTSGFYYLYLSNQQPSTIRIISQWSAVAQAGAVSADRIAVEMK